MRLRHKRPRPLNRPELVRDALRVVIASEDTYAPKQYFEESSIFRNPRIHVLTLPTTDGRSSPEHVLERLLSYKREVKEKKQLLDEDEFWLALDTDHWIKPGHVENFRKVCQEALAQEVRLAHSNPCFEVWLLLHFEELSANHTFKKSAEVEERLRMKLGSYNKRRLDLSRFDRKNATTAVERARKLAASSNDRWPKQTGSHIHRLVKRLLELNR